MLVTNMDQGRDLAATLGSNRVALMRGHGCAVAGVTLRETVFTAVYLQVNAKLQTQALNLSGEVQYLSPGELGADEGDAVAGSRPRACVGVLGCARRRPHRGIE